MKHLHNILLSAALLLAAGCASRPVDTKSRIVVSIPEQRLALFREGELVARYPVSTSKFGLGDKPGSYATPTGAMRVAQKIGHGQPPGAVFKSRRPTGEILPPNAPGRDPIVTRILWLEGLEPANRNAFHRLIYIHGTTEEANIGRPVSFGCIRMRSADVLDLFNRVGVGAQVVVTEKKIFSHVKASARSEGVAAASPQQPALSTPAEMPVEPDTLSMAAAGIAAPRIAPDRPSSPAPQPPAPAEGSESDPSGTTARPSASFRRVALLSTSQREESASGQESPEPRRFLGFSW